MKKALFGLLSTFIILVMIFGVFMIAPQKSDAVGSIKIKNIKLNVKSTTMALGNTLQLFATVTPSNVANQTLIWTSSNNRVATVSDSGIVSAVGKGSVTITAKATDGSRKSAKCKITVKQYVDQIVLNTHLVSLAGKGKSFGLKATVTPATASSKKVKWTSSNKKVATVSSSGRIKAKGSGVCTISCTATDGSGKSDHCTVLVGNPQIPPENITINTTFLSLAVGQSEKLSATIVPDYATYRAVIWSSSNPNVATVDANGTVIAAAVGNAAITAMSEDGNKSTVCDVSVYQPNPPPPPPDTTVHVTGITLNKKTMGLTAGQSETLTATISPPNATNMAVTWSSSNAGVASVDTAGKVVAVAEGSATITVVTADGNITDTCNVTVNPIYVPVTGVTLDKTLLTLTARQSDALIATVSPANATNKAVTWNSSNTNVVIVDNNGNIYAAGVGSATVTVTTTDNNKTQSCNVTVNEYLADGDYYFYLTDGGKALNLDAASDVAADKNGTKVTVWSPTGHTTQRFRVHNIGGNKYNVFAISSLNNGGSRVLDVNEYNMGRTAVGDYIDIWQQSNPNDQQWIISKTPEGYYRIELAYIPGAVIGCSTPYSNGGQITLQQYNGSGLQLWRAEPVTVTNPTYLWPLPGYYKKDITSYFGWRESTGTIHYGIDIFTGSEGKPIVSIADGRVHKIGTASKTGNYIIIDHGGNFYSEYQHLSDVYVSSLRVGDNVSKGQTIAYVGHTGYCIPDGANHLHFGIMVGGDGEVYRYDNYVNPLNYVSP